MGWWVWVRWLAANWAGGMRPQLLCGLTRRGGTGFLLGPDRVVTALSAGRRGRLALVDGGRDAVHVQDTREREAAEPGIA